MSLISCPECGKEISNTAKICPNCGLKLKQVKIPKNLLIITSLLLIIVIGTSIILLNQKPNYEKALEEFVGSCFNGKNTLEDIENLVPEDFWGEHKFESTYSLEQIVDRVTYDREEIEEKHGNIKFKYNLTKKSKLSKTAINDIEERLSWMYQDVDIDIQDAYSLDFEIYCKKENLSGDFQAYSICIDNKWYICQATPVFNDSEGITDFAIVSYHRDYVDYILICGCNEKTTELTLDEKFKEYYIESFGEALYENSDKGCSKSGKFSYDNFQIEIERAREPHIVLSAWIFENDFWSLSAEEILIEIESLADAFKNFEKNEKLRENYYLYVEFSVFDNGRIRFVYDRESEKLYLPKHFERYFELYSIFNTVDVEEIAQTAEGKIWLLENGINLQDDGTYDDMNCPYVFVDEKGYFSYGFLEWEY